MNKKTTLFLVLLFSLITNVLVAQDGANDPAFNPTDVGYGNGVNAPITDIVLQPNGKILIAGFFTRYNGEGRNYITRLNADETLDTSFNPGAGADKIVQAVMVQPDGKILLGGDFTQYNGVARNGIVRINSDGSLDNTFNPGLGINNTDNFNSVLTIALQPDGKILIGGIFTEYDGTVANNILRLNSDGSIDSTFTSTGSNGTVEKIVIQTDEKIIVAGGFTQFNDIGNNYIARLNTNGTNDTGFNTGSGASGSIMGMVVQPDGKIIISGNFTTFNGVQKYGTTRLNTNGSLDDSFIGNGVVGVNTIALQPDGKIIMGGLFNRYNNVPINNLVRLNDDGTLDTSFTANTNEGEVNINSVVLQPDGKIIIGGAFLSYNSISKNYLARLGSDGFIDDTFTIGNGTGADNAITRSLVQPDGKIVIAGYFNYYNGQVAQSIARLYPDGGLDTTFSAGLGINGSVFSITIQPDNKIILSGNFISYNGVPVNNIIRINTNGALDTNFTIDSSVVVNSIEVVAVQPDGKILIGGNFTFNNIRFYVDTVCRFNADGTLDTTFLINDLRPAKKIIIQPNGKILVGYGSSYSSLGIQYSIGRLNSDGTVDDTFLNIPYSYLQNVRDMVLQPDGKVIFAGFNSIQAPFPTVSVFARANADGSLDGTFNSGTNTGNYPIKIITLQGDGKFIITGNADYNGSEINGLARINTDGSLDDTFNAGSGLGYYNGISGIHIQPEGKLLITGTFTEYNGAGRNRIARIMSSGSMGTNAPSATGNDIIACRNNNALQITSLKQVVKSVQVYDLTGRLLSDNKNVNAANILVEDIAATHKILIVNIKLADNTTVSKKIYY